MVDSKKIKQRVKIGDTEYDIQFGINTIAGLDTILSSKMDKELTVGSFSANNNCLPLAVLEEDGKYYLKANTNFKLDNSKTNYILTQAGTWVLNNSHSHGSIISSGAIASTTEIEVNDYLAFFDRNDGSKLKKSSLQFDTAKTDFYLCQDGTFKQVSGGGGSSGGGDAYLSNTQTFTGVNTFTKNVNLNRNMSSMTDPALTFNIGQNGAARIRVIPRSNPEQLTTTFRLQPTYLGGEETLLHTGNVKTINGQSLLGSGNISISGGSTSGNWELLRSRGASSPLTSVNSGTTSGSVSLTKSISQGDVLAIELNSVSSVSYNPIVLTITVQRISTNPNSYNYEYNLESFTSWTGTELRVNNFSISASGTSLYFGNKKYIKGSFSGSTIEWTTNQSYTLYVGRVWRLVQ